MDNNYPRLIVQELEIILSSGRKFSERALYFCIREGWARPSLYDDYYGEGYRCPRTHLWYPSVETWNAMHEALKHAGFRNVRNPGMPKHPSLKSPPRRKAKA